MQCTFLHNSFAASKSVHSSIYVYDIFFRDAFWSLLLLPGSEESSSYVADHDEEVAHEEELYLLRAVVAQQILGEIGGATKFSVARQRADRFSHILTKTLKSA